MCCLDMSENSFIWCTQTSPAAHCPSLFDLQSPVCLTSVSTLYRAQAHYTFSALAGLEEVCFGMVRLLKYLKVQYVQI